MSLLDALRQSLTALGEKRWFRIAVAVVLSAVIGVATIVTYGAMARQPLRIPNGQLIFNDIAWRGFWVSRWYQNAIPEERAAMFAELFRLVGSGVVATPVEAIYPLAEIARALENAAKSGRSGKVLLRCAE